MQRIKLVLPAALAVLFSVTSCLSAGTYAAEVADLNGTWLSDLSYKAFMKIPEEERRYSRYEYAWGVGKSVPNATFEIDLAAQEPRGPWGRDGFIGKFYIIEVKQTGKNVITMRTNSALPGSEEEEADINFEFRFIDRDTMWIEEESDGERWQRAGAPWHRLSGPPR